MVANVIQVNPPSAETSRAISSIQGGPIGSAGFAGSRRALTIQRSKSWVSFSKTASAVLMKPHDDAADIASTIKTDGSIGGSERKKRSIICFIERRCFIGF